jgi:hypothetical protein
VVGILRTGTWWIMFERGGGGGAGIRRYKSRYTAETRRRRERAKRLKEYELIVVKRT